MILNLAFRVWKVLGGSPEYLLMMMMVMVMMMMMRRRTILVLLLLLMMMTMMMMMMMMAILICDTCSCRPMHPCPACQTGNRPPMHTH